MVSRGKDRVVLAHSRESPCCPFRASSASATDSTLIPLNSLRFKRCASPRHDHVCPSVSGGPQHLIIGVLEDPESRPYADAVRLMKQDLEEPGGVVVVDVPPESLLPSHPEKLIEDGFGDQQRVAGAEKTLQELSRRSLSYQG